MNVTKISFPSEVKERLNKYIRQAIKMTFYDGSIIELDNFNMTILEPHKVLFKKRNKAIIIYITENSLVTVGKSRYNFFANAIQKESKHSLNNLIKIINESL